MRTRLFANGAGQFSLPADFCCDKQSAMLNAGLTGGIGTGKSTVSRLFRDKGAVVIDFDDLVHDIQSPGTATWQAIVDAFGREILNDDDTIDRVRLGSIVFRDRTQRSTLTDIVHPAVFAAWRERIVSLKGEGWRNIVISDIPLLFETDCGHLFDVTILVYASRETQIKRIMHRNHISREEALMRLHSQMPIDEKRSLADIVIENDGDLTITRKTVDHVWQILRDRERSFTHHSE